MLARFKRGDLYDSRMVDDLRQALVATGLFATVAAEPQPTGESAGDASTPAASVSRVKCCQGSSGSGVAGLYNQIATAATSATSASDQGSHAMRRGSRRAGETAAICGEEAVDVVDNVSSANARSVAD